jgi:hypothetical protein
MQICCRPYNAFTPFCCGSLHCDGCCPIPQMPSCPMMQCGGPGPICSAMNPFGGGCGEMPMHLPFGGAPVAMPPAHGAPPGLVAPPQGPPAHGTPPGNWAPMPNGVPMPPANGTVPPVLNHTAQYPYGMPYYGVQPANYYGYPNPYSAAGYYPGAYPNMPYPYYPYGYGYYGGQRPW